MQRGRELFLHDLMRLPVRIFSDLHLGHKASRIRDVESLGPLFQGAGTVVFNGDTWEEIADPWKERSLTMLEELKRMLEREGCEGIFLRGNHDPGWDGSGWFELAGGKIIVTHGDALLRKSSPWKREILDGTDDIDQIWSGSPMAGEDIESRLDVARTIAVRLPSRHHPEGRNIFSRILDAALPPQRALEMLKAWSRQWEGGAAFCERYFPSASVLIIGHFHRSGIRSVRGKAIVNLGSFVVPGRARWCEWDGSALRVGTVRERHGKCSLGPEDAEFKFP